MENAEYQIDLMQVWEIIIKRLHIVAAAALLFAAGAFFVSNYFIPPKYAANIKFYINNQQGVLEATKVQQGDMNTSVVLVDSYIAMLKTDMVLDEVAANCDLDISAKEVSSMIRAEIGGEQAPIMKVTVVSTSPQVAQAVANTIADVAPELIQSKVKGSSAEVIDRAKLPTQPYSPNVGKNTLVGLLAGAFLGAAAVVLGELLDVRVKSSDYIEKNYDAPILGVIPKINSDDERDRGYAK